MSIKIKPVLLSNKYFTFNALVFLPSLDNDAPVIKNDWCVFTHGYTASKSDCLSWATRVSEAGSPAIIFDEPGHFLGGFHEVNSFEDFKEHAHENFITAFEKLEEMMQDHSLSVCETVVLGGHSLGAMLSLKALGLDYFNDKKLLAITVGIGIWQHKSVHLFETSFYEKTLNVRKQLVSSNLDPDDVFPWINEEKLKLNLTNKRIHMITGLDDVVVGPGGMEAMAERLRDGNNVSTHEPKKLPHHEPSGAATHIYTFLKKELSWS